VIDREARDRLALSLRRLGSGRVTASEHDEECSSLCGSPDPVIQAVAEVTYWAFCDFGPERYDGRNRLSATARRDIARVVIFLRSDYEYLWPSEHDWSIVRYIIHRLSFRFIRISSEEVARWEQVVEERAWPFVTAAEVAVAATVPAFRSSSGAGAG
jgi:hypothetical protein